MALAVKGLQDMNRAFARADKTLKTEWRQGQKRIAEPTRAAAEAQAVSRIRNMPRSPQWAGMRTGATQRVVYVAPRRKGARGRGPRARGHQFADLLMERAMEPALAQHEAQILADFERLLDTAGRDWEH